MGPRERSRWARAALSIAFSSVFLGLLLAGRVIPSQELLGGTWLPEGPTPLGLLVGSALLLGFLNVVVVRQVLTVRRDEASLEVLAGGAGRPGTLPEGWGTPEDLLVLARGAAASVFIAFTEGGLQDEAARFLDDDFREAIGRALPMLWDNPAYRGVTGFSFGMVGLTVDGLSRDMASFLATGGPTRIEMGPPAATEAGDWGRAALLLGTVLGSSSRNQLPSAMTLHAISGMPLAWDATEGILTYRLTWKVETETAGRGPGFGTCWVEWLVGSTAAGMRVVGHRGIESGDGVLLNVLTLATKPPA